MVDWFSRRVLAWRLSITMETAFCLDAVEEALAKHGRPEIFNTDQGSQFTCAAFTGLLQSNGIAVSMDGKGSDRSISGLLQPQAPSFEPRAGVPPGNQHIAKTTGRGSAYPRLIPVQTNQASSVALAIGADGVHLGDDDMPCADARRILGPKAIIGVSLIAPPNSEIGDADYFAASPVFVTDTKPDAGPPLGLAGVARLRHAVTRSLVAIGGIDHANAGQIIEAGADGVAVVSAIMAADDPIAAAARLRVVVSEASIARLHTPCRPRSGLAL